GPRVDELAELGHAGAAARRPRRVSRRAGRFGGLGGLDFSFSGLKSQALLEVERLERSLGPLDRWGGTEGRTGGAPAPPLLRALRAASRAAAVGQVLDRLERLARARPVELLVVSGGAAANRLLRRELPAWAERRGIALRLVPLAYAGDNAAMIAFAALL